MTGYMLLFLLNTWFIDNPLDKKNENKQQITSAFYAPINRNFSYNLAKT